MFALVDCNNFYASCERVFNPKWNNRPLIILSNNDGCVIARSNEAKALEIPMGAPYFKWKQTIQAHDVVVCSSNYALYGDMSNRVMHSLKSFAYDFQIYSIDEAFLSLKGSDLLKDGKEIRHTVLRNTGIPVSIGIAPTKTLAKVANHKAKKDPSTDGIFLFKDKESIDQTLDALPVTEIWGIGKQSGVKLLKVGIHSAKQLRDAPDALIKKHLSVTGLRTVWELRGTSCIPLSEIPPIKQSVTCSRTFGEPIETLNELNQAIATFTARTAEKIRTQDSLATTMLVFVTLHPYNHPGQSYFHIRVTLQQPTDYTPHLITHAKQAMSQLFTEGLRYRKAGVILDGLVPNNNFQQDLFTPKTVSVEKQTKAMQVMDQLNKKFGHRVIRSTAEGMTKHSKPIQNLCTPHYTTSWDDILTVKS